MAAENPVFKHCSCDTMTLRPDVSLLTGKVSVLRCMLARVIQTYFTSDIRDFTPESWRNLIGYVPQDPILFTGTIASNIAFGNLSATREQIEEAARQANCEFVWGMPHGFDTESE